MKKAKIAVAFSRSLGARLAAGSAPAEAFAASLMENAREFTKRPMNATIAGRSRTALFSQIDTTALKAANRSDGSIARRVNQMR
jgi:hypothetical protein